MKVSGRRKLRMGARMLRYSLASLVALSLPGMVLAQSDTEFSWSTSSGQQLTNLVDSFPACGHTLPWIWRTRIRLDFDAEATLPPAGSIEIREMLPDGALGVVDFSSAFVFSHGYRDERLLWIEETGDESVLSDVTWYAVVHDGDWPGVAPFTVAYLVHWGDANDDGRVSSVDVSAVYALPCIAGNLCNRRLDINGDGRASNADASFINFFIHSKSAVRRIPMPNGHGCSAP